MTAKISLILVLILSLFASACSKDPAVAKKEYFEKGNQYFEQQKYSEATIEYRNAIQQDPQYGEARLKLAETYIKTAISKMLFSSMSVQPAYCPKIMTLNSRQAHCCY